MGHLESHKDCIKRNSKQKKSTRNCFLWVAEGTKKDQTPSILEGKPVFESCDL